jgi:hypothetical protein
VIVLLFLFENWSVLPEKWHLIPVASGLPEKSSGGESWLAICCQILSRLMITVRPVKVDFAKNRISIKIQTSRSYEINFWARIVLRLISVTQSSDGISMEQFFNQLDKQTGLLLFI